MAFSFFLRLWPDRVKAVILFDKLLAPHFRGDNGKEWGGRKSAERAKEVEEDTWVRMFKSLTDANAVNLPDYDLNFL